MADPQTPNIGYYNPTHGSYVNTWDTPLDANFSAIDETLANVAIISLSNSPVTLTVPPTTGSSWSGPYQSQSAVVRFTGALTSNVTVTLPRAGFWIVENLTSGAFIVILASGSPGNVICAPPGEMTHVFCDSTDVRYVDFGRIGSYIDLAVSAVPAWISNCTVSPYLNCDGGTFNATTYPALNTILGGNTLPDLRGRVRAALNQTTGRISASGVNGDVIFSAGGADTEVIGQPNLPNVSFTVTIPAGQGSHSHVYVTFGAGGFGAQANAPGTSGSAASTQASTLPSMTGTAASGGSGTALPTMPPVQIAGLTLIRAG